MVNNASLAEGGYRLDVEFIDWGRSRILASKIMEGEVVKTQCTFTNPRAFTKDLTFFLTKFEELIRECGYFIDFHLEKGRPLVAPFRSLNIEDI